MKWKYHRKKRTASGHLSEERWEMEGLEARGARFSNAHELKVGRSYNGSGPKAFGGAKSWPNVQLKVSFQEGEEKKAREFARRLRIFVAEFNNDQLDPGPATLV